MQTGLDLCRENSIEFIIVERKKNTPSCPYYKASLTKLRGKENRLVSVDFLKDIIDLPILPLIISF